MKKKKKKTFYTRLHLRTAVGLMKKIGREIEREDAKVLKWMCSVSIDNYLPFFKETLFQLRVPPRGHACPTLDVWLRNMFSERVTVTSHSAAC